MKRYHREFSKQEESKDNHKRARIQISAYQNLENNFIAIRNELFENVMKIADKLEDILLADTLHPKFKRVTFEASKEIIDNYRRLSAQLTPNYYEQKEIDAFSMKCSYAKNALEVIYMDHLKHPGSRREKVFLEDHLQQGMQAVYGSEENFDALQNLHDLHSFNDLEGASPHEFFEKPIQEELSDIKKEIAGVIEDKQLLDEYAETLSMLRMQRKDFVAKMQELYDLEKIYMENKKEPLKAGIRKYTVMDTLQKLENLKISFQNKPYLFDAQTNQRLKARFGILEKNLNDLKLICALTESKLDPFKPSFHR